MVEMLYLLGFHASFRDELIDHVSSDVENRMASGLTFEQALAQIEPELRSKEIKRINRLLIPKSKSNNGAMIKNYLNVAIRNLRKNKTYSFINISGLAIGIACTLLIALYVLEELSYDNFHPQGDRTYRVVTKGIAQGESFEHARTAMPWGPSMADDLPEIENFLRIRTPNSRFMVQYEDRKFYEKGFFFVDSTFFDVLGYQLILGNAQDVLRNPNSVVVSERAARKFFGEEDPLGKTIKADISLELTVTGIMADPPDNAHMHFDFLVSLNSIADYRDAQGNLIYGNIFENWLWRSTYTYLLLGEEADPTQLQNKFSAFLDHYAGDQFKQFGLEYNLELQPIRDIHLNSHLESEIEGNGNISYIYIFSAVALFVLFIACINFMNLSTARSIKRSKEVGLRKAVGAARHQLITQFLGESMVITVVASTLALMLVVVLLPIFTGITGQQIELIGEDTIAILLGLIAITVLVGVISGSYPAAFLSGFNPALVLKGKGGSDAGNRLLRKVLVMVQFTISALLVIGIGVVYLQMQYIQEKELGFDKEYLLAIPQPEPVSISRYPTLKSRLQDHPKVIGVTAASRIPGEFFGTGFTRKFGAPVEENVAVQSVSVDFNFAEVLGMQIATGRNFSEEFGTDSLSAVMINEAAVTALNLEDPLQEQLAWFGQVGAPIVGVVKDFHFKSLHDPIEPFLFFISGYNFLWVLAKVEAEDLPQTIAYIEDQWATINPQHPFDYEFLSDKYGNLYQAESQLGNILNFFAAIAMFIAGLGLFGLVSFTTEQRTKEIGIRKTLGAPTANIVLLLMKGFAGLVLAANLVAIPIGYYFMNSWLQNFTYHSQLNVVVFIVAIVSTLLLAIITVSYKSIKAALTNPVKSLKYE